MSISPRNPFLPSFLSLILSYPQIFCNANCLTLTPRLPSRSLAPYAHPHTVNVDLLVSASSFLPTPSLGDIAQQQREITLQSFREGKFRVLVCTDVAARGVSLSVLPSLSTSVSLSVLFIPLVLSSLPHQRVSSLVSLPFSSSPFTQALFPPSSGPFCLLPFFSFPAAQYPHYLACTLNLSTLSNISPLFFAPLFFRSRY